MLTSALDLQSLYEYELMGTVYPPRLNTASDQLGNGGILLVVPFLYSCIHQGYVGGMLPGT